MPPRRILVVGGAGAFGSRLVERILATTDHVVVIAGRDAGRTTVAAAELSRLHPGFPVEAVTLDGTTADAAALKALRLYAVVDAAGPFQGGRSGLAEAAIAAGCHYIDLSDARDHVAAFPALDAAARRAGVVALAGASSTPALSHAVADRLTRNWRRIDHVFVGIAAGNRAPRGLSVIRSILSWVGRPVRVFVGGDWQVRPGWSLSERRDIRGLGRRWLSLADTPDLDLLVARYRPTRSAIMKAGLELSVLHRGLAALALLARLPFAPDLVRFARPLQRVATWLEPYGSDRGGMIVEAVGLEATGRRVKATWTLVAEAGSGPSVPTLPAVAALKVITDGKMLPRADAAAGRIPLEAIEAEIARLPMTTQTTLVALEPLFRHALGAAFERLPARIRAAHKPAPVLRLKGRARVAGPSNRLAGLVARLFGLPPDGDDVELAVAIEDLAGTGGEGEIWTRDFAGRRFESRLAARAAGSAEIEERFGPFAFRLALDADPSGLTMRVAGWRLGPIPLPRRLAPIGDATETVDTEGRFRFAVEMHLPLGLGRVVAYRGWLVPTSERAGG